MSSLRRGRHRLLLNVARRQAVCVRLRKVHLSSVGRRRSGRTLAQVKPVGRVVRMNIADRQRRSQPLHLRRRVRSLHLSWRLRKLRSQGLEWAIEFLKFSSKNLISLYYEKPRIRRYYREDHYCYRH